MSEEQNGFNKIVKKFINDVPYVNSDGYKELEVRFQGNRINKVSKIDYDNICRKLLSSGFKLNKNEENMLRISNQYVDAKTGRTKISNVRTEISGLENIKMYCKSNQLPESNMFKLTKKSMITDSDNNIIYPYDIRSYKLRLSYSLESLINKSSKFGSNIIDSWTDSKKIFRYINRVTLTHPDFPLKVDCSIVKTSSMKDKYMIPTYTVEESNLFDNPEFYEIEIEADNTKLEGVSAQLLIQKLMTTIKYVLGGLQQTNYPVSFTQLDGIANEYLNVIKNTSKYLKSNTFIGPSSHTLQINNIIDNKNTNSDIPNIRENYTVTDKADGIRKLLFINKSGSIYLINTNMNIEFTGAITNNPNCFNSIIDGEHILHNKKGEYINLYAAFDIYYVNNNDVRAKHFAKGDITDENSNYRLQILSEFVDKLEMKGFTESEKIPIRVEVKKFYISEGSVTIFMGCKQIIDRINNNQFEYETDGLIFTPANYGVGLTKTNTELKNIKISWEYSFKWKPSIFNTIDFYVTTKKNESGMDIVSNIFENGDNTTSSINIKQYKTLSLRVGFDEKRDGYINPCLDVINDNINTNNTENNDSYKPTLFYPTNPYDQNAHICNIILKKDANGVMQMFTLENEVITDNTIVEFSYELDKEIGWKWVPLRIRWDKTAELKNGGRNYGNSYTVANNNWQSIHNPITENMITMGEDIVEENDIYYAVANKSTNTKSLRDFHNLYVKNMLIKSVSQSGYTLIDLAVGKGGDWSKWIDARLSFVFGIDISKDNIENRIDGACARYLNYRKKYTNMPSALFVNGNSGLNIKSGDALFSDREKTITKAVFGVGEKSESKLGKGVYKNYGKAKEGFNISSCQFAAHYFFENSNTLNNFLQNISDCTKVGGHFIGCCYDGYKIFKELNNKNKGEGISLFNNDDKIWEIIKQYDNKEFLNDESSLGYPVDVYQETIGKSFREFLVNFDYFTQLMENYGFVLLTKEEANAMKLPNSTGLFNELYTLMETQIKSNKKKYIHLDNALNMTIEEKQISFYNRYFVFKKVRNVGTITKINETTTIIKIKPRNIKKLDKRITIKTD